LDTGEERLVTFAVTDENGDSVWGAQVTFESSNPAVAPVRRLSDTEAPLVTGLTTGSATVTLTSGGLTAEVPVTVAQIPASVTITPSDLVLSSGGSEQAAVTINDRTGDEIAPPAPFTWSSSDEAVVTVSPTGFVTSVRPEGSAVITATADTFTATLPVFVGTPPPVEMLGRVELFFAEGVAVTPDGRYFVGGAEHFGRGVLPDFTLPVRIPIGGQLTDVVLNADGTRAYLIGPSRVAVVDLTTNTQVDFIEVSLGGGIAGALSADGSVLTVGTTHGFERFEVATKRPLGGTAVGFVLKITHHPTRPLLYASNELGVLELDDRSGEIVRRIGGTADSHVLSPDGKRLYVVSGGGGGIAIWNLETEAQEPSAGPVFGNDLSVSPDGRFLYVMRSSNIDGRLYVVDARSGTTLREVVLGGLPKRIAMSADGVAIITNEGDTDVFGWVDFVR
jgi:WD40 repeat protein